MRCQNLQVSITPHQILQKSVHQFSIYYVWRGGQTERYDKANRQIFVTFIAISAKVYLIRISCDTAFPCNSTQASVGKSMEYEYLLSRICSVII